MTRRKSVVAQAIDKTIGKPSPTVIDPSGGQPGSFTGSPSGPAEGSPDGKMNHGMDRSSVLLRQLMQLGVLK